MRAATGLRCAVLWLISNREIYLNGFWNRGIQPKRGKDSQKDGGGNCGSVPFTMPALTMVPRLRGLTVYLGSIPDSPVGKCRGRWTSGSGNRSKHRTLHGVGDWFQLISFPVGLLPWMRPAISIDAPSANLQSSLRPRVDFQGRLQNSVGLLAHGMIGFRGRRPRTFYIDWYELKIRRWLG